MQFYLSESIFQINRDFTHSWRLRNNNNNNFYLTVTECLASPGGTNFRNRSKKCQKKNWMFFLKRFRTSASKKDGTLSVQWNPSESRHWSFPSLAAAQQTVFGYLRPRFYSSNKALEHLQKTSEKLARFPAYLRQETVRNKLPMNRWRKCSTAVISDGLNYRGRPSFTSVSFSADQDERINRRSQKTSKCGKNISDTLGYRLVCHSFVLTTFWRHLWSITEQTLGNMESIC